MNSADSWYYSRLSKEGQRAYHEILTGLEAIAPSFSVPMMQGKELSEIYYKVRLDHPEIFYTVRYRCRYYDGADHMELLPEYMFEKKKILEHRKALTARVEKLVRPAEKLGEKEKEQYIHDFVCQNIRYDKLKKDYSHEIIGALGQGVAVCEGIAKAVKLLCTRLGLWCVTALSEANPEKGIRYRHAWNIVRIGGVYYHLDATFDNTLGAGTMLRYDYFNLGDRQIFRDHEPLVFPVPACPDTDHSWYREKKLSFTKAEDVSRRAEQSAKKGKDLLFQWRGGYLTREVLQDLLSMIKAAAEKKNKYAAVSLNWPQAVLHVRFLTELPAEEVVVEEANEGELDGGAAGQVDPAES